MTNKFCVNCKYHITVEYDRSPMPIQHVCVQPSAQYLNIVTGEKETTLCTTARSLACGYEGKLWEAKNG